MATRVFADEELERLRRFPGIRREELFRYFTLTPADLAFVDPGRGRGPADRLGLSIALCTLPWLGFVPDRLTTAPPVAVAWLATHSPDTRRLVHLAFAIVTEDEQDEDAVQVRC